VADDHEQYGHAAQAVELGHALRGEAGDVARGHRRIVDDEGWPRGRLCFLDQPSEKAKRAK